MAPTCCLCWCCACAKRAPFRFYKSPDRPFIYLIVALLRLMSFYALCRVLFWCCFLLSNVGIAGRCCADVAHELQRIGRRAKMTETEKRRSKWKRIKNAFFCLLLFIVCMFFLFLLVAHVVVSRFLRCWATHSHSHSHGNPTSIAFKMFNVSVFLFLFFFFCANFRTVSPYVCHVRANWMSADNATLGDDTEMSRQTPFSW